MKEKLIPVFFIKKKPMFLLASSICFPMESRSFKVGLQRPARSMTGIWEEKGEGNVVERNLKDLNDFENIFIEIEGYIFFGKTGEGGMYI